MVVDASIIVSHGKAGRAALKPVARMMEEIVLVCLVGFQEGLGGSASSSSSPTTVEIVSL